MPTTTTFENSELTLHQDAEALGLPVSAAIRKGLDKFARGHRRDAQMWCWDQQHRTLWVIQYRRGLPAARLAVVGLEDEEQAKRCIVEVRRQLAEAGPHAAA